MAGLEGTRLGDYELIERIGIGGMAEVYRARQLTAFGREVALKVMLSDLGDSGEFRIRFLREAQAISRLSHPNILPLIEFGEEHETLYLVTPLMRGGTLRDLLKQHDGPLPLEEGLPLFLQLCQAVQYAHQEGIIHRDIKPSNILLQQDNHPLLADFGIARDRSAAKITAAGARIGTLDYMAPEQAVGQADLRSDIYSLGVILYQLLTGRLPYEGSTPLFALVKQSSELPTDPRTFTPTLPPRMVEILKTALARDPNERFQSVGALSNAVRQTLADAAPRSWPSLSIPAPIAGSRLPNPSGQGTKTIDSFATMPAEDNFATQPSTHQAATQRTQNQTQLSDPTPERSSLPQQPTIRSPTAPGNPPPGAVTPPPAGFDLRQVPPVPRRGRTSLIVLLALLAAVVILGGVGVLLLKSFNLAPATSGGATATATRPVATATPAIPAGFSPFTSPDRTFKLIYPTAWQGKPAAQFTGTGEEFDGPAGQGFVASNQGASQTDPVTNVNLFCSSFVIGMPGPTHSVTINHQRWTQEACDSFDGTTHAIIEAVNYKGNTYIIVYLSPQAQFNSDRTKYYVLMEQSFTFLV